MKAAVFLIIAIIVTAVPLAGAQSTINLDANKLIKRAGLYLSPKSGSFQEGSTFDVGIYLDTRGSVLNTVELHISFPKDKLTLVRPLGGRSIIGVWLEAPTFSNVDGTAAFIGIIPNGIKTNSGLIGTMTFRAVSSGEAVINILPNSRVLVNDGVGTEAVVDFGSAVFSVLPKPPEGVLVFSDTHPVQDFWYNNNNPVFNWQKETGVSGFSYLVDTEPLTVPDNSLESTTTTSTAFQNLKDGAWYFHVKAQKNGAWGSATHFATRIDTEPPARFSPKSQIIDSEHVLISFFTTDVLSGIDHYEVGVVDRSQPSIEAPAFVVAESPYQLPDVPDNARVVIRAIDKAGNVRDEALTVRTSLHSYLQANMYLILILLLALVVILLLHYFFGHHLVAHAKRFIALWKKEEAAEDDHNQNGPPR